MVDIEPSPSVQGSLRHKRATNVPPTSRLQTAASSVEKVLKYNVYCALLAYRLLSIDLGAESAVAFGWSKE
jgi:hypothetical protein